MTSLEKTDVILFFFKKTNSETCSTDEVSHPIWIVRTEKTYHKLDEHKGIYVDWFWMLSGSLSSRVTSFGYLTGTYCHVLNLLIISVECVLWCVYVAWYFLALVCACVCMYVKVHTDEGTLGSQRSGSDGFLQTLFSFYLLFLKWSLLLNLKLVHGCGQAFQPVNFRNSFVSDAHHLRVPGTFCHTRLLI